MKPVIKKVKNALKIVTINLVMVGTILSTTSCLNSKFKNLNSDEDIISISEKIDCDISYLREHAGNYLRMQHNNGEPVYVCFDSMLTEEEKTAATSALDYVFGAVGKINDKYKYEIVDKATFDTKLNKSRIFYSLGEYNYATYDGEEYYAEGFQNSTVGFFTTLTDKPGSIYHTINIDRERASEIDEYDRLKYVMTHELLHAFGFDDVYYTKMMSDTKRFNGNTLMNNDNAGKIEFLTPNDIKCLILLYAEKDKDKKELKEILNEYSTKFYDAYTKKCLEKANLDGDFECENFSFETKIRVTDVDGTQFGYVYCVEVKDGKYVFAMYDFYTNEQLDVCEGQVVNQNGVVVLKDIDLKYGFRPYEEHERYHDGLVQDLIIASKDDSVVMYDFLINDIRPGEFHELEKNMMQ